jgi:lipoprotein-anchoring transpeptidase ErfK/SrfK
MRRACLFPAMSKQLFRILVVAIALAAAAPALAKVEIVVDLGRQRMTVKKQDGEMIVWKVSSGRPGFETPTGVFNVQRMDAEHLSDEYDQAPMPYAIFFYRGLAIHGTYERGLGRPASHGCVRLAINNARELYSWVEQYGAKIEIAGSAGDAPRYDVDLARAPRQGTRREFEPPRQPRPLQISPFQIFPF